MALLQIGNWAEIPPISRVISYGPLISTTYNWIQGPTSHEPLGKYDVPLGGSHVDGEFNYSTSTWRRLFGV